ncbi:hypothetical protein [Amycolatopsis sp. NPDC021455]|uniref:hypothetical protein n=1 Tax=Amycolatopsis sp. NPDC021455 TaxID=3154901 RepID=UPI0033C6F44E
MSVIGNVITAVVALLGVVLGGWLTLRNQDRSWSREHARQWRDIRLETYNEFLAAYRQYVAFTLEPTAKIAAIPHPRLPDQMMPFFDEAGRPYKEKFESALTAVRLVSDLPDTVRTCVYLVRAARQVAAARATLSEADLTSDSFANLWSAEKEFLAAAREELGLSAMPRTPGYE